ncbi:MAG TPA: hypothetical protein VGF75_02630 [Candidatus Saccharimonadales bacterium]|jgi:hypothetical protein
MTTPRLSEAPSADTRLTAASSDGGIDSEKIAKSESLSALFSYFKNWAPNDPSLKFKGSSVIKEIDSEVAA